MQISLTRCGIRWLIIIALVLHPGISVSVLYAQSLVHNYSFEEIDSCGIQLSQLASGWSMATVQGTPDLFNECSEDPIFRVPNIFQGCDTVFAKTGKGYSGLIVYGNFAREYLQAPLTRPLTPGKEVFVAFHVSPTVFCQPNLRRFTDAIGMAFSDTLLVADLPQSGNDVLPLQTVIENRGTVIDDAGSWLRVEGCHEATGNESYVVIGSFTPDEETLLEAAYPWAVVQNYLLVDDILVTPFDPLPDTVLMCDGSTTLNGEFLDFIPHWSTGESGVEITVYEEGTYIASIELDSCILYDTVLVLDGTTTEKSEIRDTICPGDAITLASDLPGGYLWSTGSSENSITVSIPGRYGLTVTNDCGKSILNYDVKTHGCDCAVFIANAFSPNGDGVNDLLGINVSCPKTMYRFGSMSVFDRWGNMIYRTTDESMPWNGQYSGSHVEPGIYTWLLKYDIEGFDGYKPVATAGTVSVIR